VAELADALDSKSSGSDIVSVRVRPSVVYASKSFKVHALKLFCLKNFKRLIEHVYQGRSNGKKKQTQKGVKEK
jgi:hypothetical protein